jgi:hypothetical protein
MQATQPTAEDIAYVRHLAESGANAPLLGGRFMAWWGLLVAIAYAAHHFALRGDIGDGRTIFGIIWMSFAVAGLLGQFALARTMPRKSGAGSAGNRASRAAWISAACGIVSVVAGAAIAARNGAGPGTFDLSVPVAFSVYACALIVTGSLAANRIIFAAGAGAILMAGLFTAFILHPDRYLLASLGVALTVLLPGLLLVWAEPRAAD